jgi:hypothetical protein
MLEALPYVVAAIAAMAAWVSGLALLDVLTSSDVRAWRRISALRGYATPRPKLARARLLALADRTETPLAFLARALGLALLVFAAVLTADSLGRAALGDWPLSPWVGLLLGALVVPVSVIELRQNVRRTQTLASQALGDMMVLVAVMTDSRGLQLGDAVRILSRCARDDALCNLVDRGGWKRLVHEPFRSTGELYRLIGRHYDLPLFVQLADAAVTTNVGFPERDAYTRVATSFYQQRLADARMRAARTKVLVTLPVAAMLIPLLLLIGAPTFHIITRGLAGG